MPNLIQRIEHIFNASYRSVIASMRRGFVVIYNNRRPFLIIQAGYWATYGLGTLLALRFPGLQTSALSHTKKQLDEYQAGRSVVAAYKNGSLANAALMTLAINLGVGAFGTITLPSCLVPFSGIALAAYRAYAWGLIFAPNADKSLTLPHFVTMLVEGQAYIAAATGAWIQGRGFLQNFDYWKEIVRGKRRVRWVGYKEGWRETLWLYAPISVTLVIAAVWEAYEVIHLTGMKD